MSDQRKNETSRRTPARITRRQWNTTVAAVLGASPAVAQVTSKTPPQGAPAPAQPPATPQQKLQKAYDDVHKVTDRLAQLEVPMDIEPAFNFRA